MKKRNYWPLFFIGIFTFTLGMIFWTIKSAINTPVNEDETFLVSYHHLDENFNNIMASNEEFKKSYTFILNINGKELELTTSDIYASQRIIEKKSKHKDMYKLGNNIISISVQDKDNKALDNLEINFSITVATNNKSDINLSNKDLEYKNNKYVTIVKIPKVGNWNITGSVKTQDGNKGYFFIKSNAI
ncbi:MAG: hypothetical protein HRT42_03190 [Campylobacteraceae bacterium]|nr:hypothetical protein [Campylobacteraceae bacterium]